MREVGLDIDRHDGAEIEARVVAMPSVTWLDRRRSAGGNLHYRIGLRAHISVEESFTLRRNLGDDPTRIMADKHRHAVGESIDVLYETKGNGVATAWARVFAATK